MRVQTIANTKITVVEHNEERVLTTKQLAQIYECEPKQIKQNFSNNRERFILGKHYFQIDGDELKNLRDKLKDLRVEIFDPQISPKARSLYLWTRRGAARHCKMLGTEKAWEMFDALEDNYFNKPAEPPKPMSQLDILVESAKALQAHERELARLKMDTEEIREEQKKQAARMDDLNGVCTSGTLRQRLVIVVNAYAREYGLTYDRAWRDFKAAYNVSFHTNIALSRYHYAEQNNLRKVPSVPEYLEKKGLLGDALRVADKLLHGGRIA